VIEGTHDALWESKGERKDAREIKTGERLGSSDGKTLGPGGLWENSRTMTKKKKKKEKKGSKKCGGLDG